MGSKNKLKRFKENETFDNVFQPKRDELVKSEYEFKGNWRTSVFKNDNPMVLELGCGRGEYSVELAKKFIDLLLANDANINATNKYQQAPLSYIASSGNSQIAKHLILKGAKIGNEVVSTAASYQNNDYLTVLLENGGSPGGESQNGTSPLENSIFCCGDGFNEARAKTRLPTVELLLKHGAKPSTTC